MRTKVDVDRSLTRVRRSAGRATTRRSLQDSLPAHHCWGCGTLNDRGLHIASYWRGRDETICRWQPGSHHAAGPLGVLNGGIIATLVDCHSVCTAIADAQRSMRDSREPDAPWYVTGSLRITYLRPAPTQRSIVLRARITERTATKTVVACSLLAGRAECARADVVAVRVPPSWGKENGR